MQRVIPIQQKHYKPKLKTIDKPHPQPHLPLNLRVSVLNLLDLHPEEVARQMTLIEHNLLQKIQPREWLTNTWSQKQTTGNIGQVVDRFNFVSRWVSTEIVTADTVEHRVVLINRFLIIASVRRQTPWHFFWNHIKIWKNEINLIAALKYLCRNASKSITSTGWWKSCQAWVHLVFRDWSKLGWRFLKIRGRFSLNWVN